jgi:hypothetical protein
MAIETFPFHDSAWNIDYHAACIEPSISRRSLMVQCAIATCNDALHDALSSDERIAVYVALRDLMILRLVHARHESRQDSNPAVQPRDTVRPMRGQNNL